MKDFDLLCKEFEKMDALSYGAYITEKAAQILPALEAITESGRTGSAIFFSFIIGAIVADGKIAEEEYALVYPLLDKFFGQTIEYEDCKALLKKYKKESKELKVAVDQMVDLLGLLSEDLKNDIVIVCLMICAIDGKVSLSEKKWIKQLMA